MLTATKAARTSPARRTVPGFATEIAEFLHSLATTLFDPYRPELHYMRGPGPKWHAKHDRAQIRAPAALGMVAIPAFARIRVRR